MARTIEHRTNNAYDTILLIENGKVVGNWTIGTYGDELNNFENPGDLSHWEPTEVESINAGDYGELVSTQPQPQPQPQPKGDYDERVQAYS